MKKYLILAFWPIAVAACVQQKSDLEQASNINGGRCYLTKNSSNYFCLQTNNSSDSNTGSNTCSSLLSTYGSLGVNGMSWLSGNANTCSTSSTAGSCTRTDGVIYYYLNDFNNASAQADCTNRFSGTYNTP